MEDSCSCGGYGCVPEGAQLYHLYEVTLKIDDEEVIRIVPILAKYVTDNDIREDIKKSLMGEFKVISYKRFDPKNIKHQ